MFPPFPGKAIENGEKRGELLCAGGEALQEARPQEALADPDLGPMLH